MTPAEARYITETARLALRLKDNPGWMAQYVITCHNYIRELKEKDTLELFFKTEYEKLFNLLLCLVEEDYKPSQFLSVCNFELIEIFEPEFIIYMLRVQNQLKKPVSWSDLCELQYQFSLRKLTFDVKTRFMEDFTQFAVDNLTLTELWMPLNN